MRGDFVCVSVCRIMMMHAYEWMERMFACSYKTYRTCGHFCWLKIAERPLVCVNPKNIANTHIPKPLLHRHMLLWCVRAFEYSYHIYTDITNCCGRSAARSAAVWLLSAIQTFFCLFVWKHCFIEFYLAVAWSFAEYILRNIMQTDNSDENMKE